MINTVIAVLETSATEAAQEARAGRQLSAPQVTLQHYSSLCQLRFHIFTEKNRVSLSSIDSSVRFEEKGRQSKGQKNDPTDDCN